MPDIGDFLSGFNLLIHETIGKYELVYIQADHIMIQRYRQYQYPIELIFNGIGDVNNLISQVKQQISGNRVIHSRYGNPYSCRIEYLDHSQTSPGRVIIKLLGYSTRI